MPTYEYECPKCRQEFELFQSMNDAPLKKCPQCGKTGVKRKIGGGAGLIFKGTGFYITDYKTKSGAPAAESKPTPETKPAASESKPAPEKKSEPKAASKSAAKSSAKK